MKKAYRRMSLVFLCVCILLCNIMQVVAVSSSEGVSVAEYLAERGVVLEANDNISLVELKTGVVNDQDKGNKTAASESENKIYGIAVERMNTDGTYTTQVVCDVYLDSRGKIGSSIQPQSISTRGLVAAPTGRNVLTPLSVIVGSGDVKVRYCDFNFVMEATYYKENMANYGSTGNAYAPYSSRFKVTRNSGNWTMTNTYFTTEIATLWAVDISDPSVAYEDGPYHFVRSYYSGTPILNYQYNFNDYNYYCSATDERDSYEDYLLSLVFDGIYTLQTNFSIGSVDYYVTYDVDGGDSETGVNQG